MTFTEHSNNSGTVRTLFHMCAVAFVLFVFALPRPAFANASVFVNTSVCPYSFCSSASVFGVLAGPGDALKFSGDTILNDVALGVGTTIAATNTTVGSNTSADVVDFSNSLVNGNSGVDCTGTGNTGSGCHTPSSPASSFGSTGAGTASTVWGGTRSNPTLVNDAYTQFTALATYWNNQPSTGTVSKNLSGNWNIQNAVRSDNTYIFNAASGFTPGSLTIRLRYPRQCDRRKPGVQLKGHDRHHRTGDSNRVDPE
jgi:hypothetical protein